MATDPTYTDIDVFRGHLDRLRPILLQKKDRAYANKLSGRKAMLFKGRQMARPLSKPLRFMLSVSDTLSKRYQAAEQASGRSLLKQLKDHLVLQRKYGLGGRYYYEFQLYDEAFRCQAPYFLTNDDMDAVVLYLRTAVYPEDGDTIADKFLFYEHCQKHALPTIPVLAVFTDGQARFVGVRDAADLPPQNLFSKPTDWWGGMKAMRWRYQPDGTYLNRKGTAYSPADVVGSLAKASRERPYLLQPCLSNHADLQALTGETLVCVRIVTVRCPHQSPEAVVAYIKLPLARSVIAAFRGEHALGAPVDVLTGTVGQASSLEYGETNVERFIERHPDTGLRIAGFQIPDWQAGIELVLRAHSTFNKIAYVGWDVAFTDDGPVLIEGNTMPGIEGIQITHQRPMGDTQIVRCLNQYLG